MKRLIALPTWCITLMAIPFLPKKHPWKGRYYSLSRWESGQTDLCKQFDSVFWLLGIILAVLLFAVSAHAQTATLTWDANTESDLAGYNVYCGGIKTDVGHVTHFTPIPPNTPCTVTAYDTSGNESVPSDVVVWNMPDTEPPVKAKSIAIDCPQGCEVYINGILQ